MNPNPQLLFCQDLNSPVVGWESIRVAHQKPDDLLEAEARVIGAERLWLTLTDSDAPQETVRLAFEALQEAEAARCAAWQRWNASKEADLAAHNQLNE